MVGLDDPDETLEAQHLSLLHKLQEPLSKQRISQRRGGHLGIKFLDSNGKPRPSYEKIDSSEATEEALQAVSIHDAEVLNDALNLSRAFWDFLDEKTESISTFSVSANELLKNRHKVNINATTGVKERG